MTWAPVDLATPVSSAAGLNNAIRIETITPWTHGAKEGNGNHTWLSFPNAVAALVKRIQANPAQAMFVLALTAASYKDLASQCGQLAAVFPLKQLEEWQRKAAKLVTLEATKMNLVPDAGVSLGLQLNAMPTIKARMQKAISQQAKAAAAGLASADPLAALGDVEAEKGSFDAGVDAALPNLSGGTGWRFYADSDLAAKLVNGHPGSQFTYTALIAFIGSAADLAFLTEMMPA